MAEQPVRYEMTITTEEAILGIKKLLTRNGKRLEVTIPAMVFEYLHNRRNRLGERPLMFEIDSAEAWDIDEELDFAIVDFLLTRSS